MPLNDKDIPKTNEREQEITKIPYNFFEARCFQYERRIDEQREEFFRQIEKEKKDKFIIIRHLKQAIVMLIVLIGLILGGIIGTAIYVLNNYDFTAYSQEVQSGFANYIGNDGEIINGETDYKKDNQ